MPDEPSRTWTNRRRYARVAFPSPVIIVSADDVATLRARDIGAGGIHVLAPRAPPLGSQVRIEFDLGQTEHYSVTGTVIRDETSHEVADRRGFAVKFDVEDDVRQRLAALLRA